MYYLTGFYLKFLWRTPVIQFYLTISIQGTVHFNGLVRPHYITFLSLWQTYMRNFVSLNELLCGWNILSSGMVFRMNGCYMHISGKRNKQEITFYFIPLIAFSPHVCHSWLLFHYNPISCIVWVSDLVVLTGNEVLWDCYLTGKWYSLEQQVAHLVLLCSQKSIILQKIIWSILT